MGGLTDSRSAASKPLVIVDIYISEQEKLSEDVFILEEDQHLRGLNTLCANDGMAVVTHV